MRTADWLCMATPSWNVDDGAVVVLAIQYGGDAIGHTMECGAHDNTAPPNIRAILSDIM